MHTPALIRRHTGDMRADHPPVNMEQDATQPSTDPRRMGRNNSGLSEADVSDVMCILHPCSPAAFGIVAYTAERSPQNVLQNDGYGEYDDGLTQSLLEEQETFILNGDGPHQAMDLALRFSARTIDPALGFVFGRNANLCDIVLSSDLYKRVSNMHFSIFMNDSGVLMLQDFSTNGTMVDETVLRSKNAVRPQTRMLEPGSIIQILSPKSEEIVKFIVRLPSRDGHIEAYESKFRQYMHRRATANAAQEHATQYDHRGGRLADTQARPHGGSSHKVPLVHKTYGMHWNGGEKYNVVGLIGKGAFATVFQLATKSEGKLYAAKELEKRKFMKNGVLDRKLDNEMQIMKAISHPNIVQYVDYQDVAGQLYIIMEFVPCGDLQQYLSLYGPLNEPLGKKMAGQVLDSLTYLHAKKITHRDIKPDNILLANVDPETFTIKLSDFGLSKVVKDNDTFLKTFCGTLLYCAPEVFPHYDAHVSGRGQKRPRKSTGSQAIKFHSYSQSVDIWSFGAVLWYSLCLKPPFEGVADNTGRGMFEKIMLTPLDPRDLVKQGVSDNAVDLLADMLNTDPASRPSPTHCLRHKWFGQGRSGHGQATVGAASPEPGLDVIAEEDEVEAGGEPDVAGLSLDEHEGGDSQDSHYDEASIHSGSMNFFDPRQSKRIKSNAFAYREQVEAGDSSPELFYQSIPIMHQPDNVVSQQPKPAQRKLFGEISLSEMQNGILGTRVSEGSGDNARSGNGIGFSLNGSDAQPGLPRGPSESAMASKSLQGAESMMRDVRMDSPHGTDSPAAEPRTPDTPSRGSIVLSKGTPNAPNDITPKAAQPGTFNRQISIPIPPSFFYVAHDASTHNLEYASKVSGHDFAKNPNYIVNGRTSQPDTVSLTGTDTEEEHQDDTDAEPELPALLPPPPEFVKPKPRLGRLISTPDSFANITLNIEDRSSSWGRWHDNTHVYPDKNDTRIPKRAFMLWFDSEDMHTLPPGGDWARLPSLYCVITTDSRSGIWVNGVHLKAGTDEKRWYGRVYSGDEIQVCPGSGHRGLKFVCEFFHGKAREARATGAPKFEVVSLSAPGKGKGKEREKEEGNVKAAVSAK